MALSSEISFFILNIYAKAINNNIMSVYENRFKKFLVEKDEELTDDQQAMAQTLDQGSNIQDFDVQDVPPADAQAVPTMSSVQRKMYDELRSWIQRIDDFSGFLNGTNPDSVQSRLNSAEPDTLFDKISTAETKKIARVAVELTSLNEMLKGYLASANDPKYRYN
jgi:hypothetical protein